MKDKESQEYGNLFASMVIKIDINHKEQLAKKFP